MCIVFDSIFLFWPVKTSDKILVDLWKTDVLEEIVEMNEQEKYVQSFE